MSVATFSLLSCCSVVLPLAIETKRENRSSCVAYVKFTTFRETTAAALQDAVGGFLPAFSSSIARQGEGGIVLSAVAEAMAD